MAAPVVLNPFVVDRRLQTIYGAVNTNNISKAAAVTNDTLRLMNTASYSELDRQTHDYIVSNLYTSLVDMAMGRLAAAHSKIRDCHYQMLKVDLERQEVRHFDPCQDAFQQVFDVDYLPPCPSPAELVPENDYELEQLMYILFNGTI